MKDQAPTLLKKIRNKETMPTHWYSCKRIHHRMGTGVKRLKEIDAANPEFITCFFCVLFSFPIMLSALDVPKTVSELLKVNLCWCDKMFAEISGCMLKIRSNKAEPKKLTYRLSVLMMLFFCQRCC